MAQNVYNYFVISSWLVLLIIVKECEPLVLPELVPVVEHAAQTGEKIEKGGGHEHHSVGHSEHGQKGDKGYKAFHEEEVGKKGHVDKEGHQGHYEQKGGDKKEHHHKDGYHSAHEKGEKGEKGSIFEEEGSYKKGHSTHGGHHVHKLNEYNKKVEFWDEDHDEASKEKHGGFENSRGHKAGGKFKKGHSDAGHHVQDFGKHGGKEAASHYNEDAGHKKVAGLDEHFEHGENYGKKDEGAEQKKWLIGNTPHKAVI